jgi:nicotinamidase/pyrazinamidase
LQADELPPGVGFAMIRSVRADVMARIIFWDEDTQHDFMSPDGKLYVPGAEDIIPNLERLTRCARQRGIQIMNIMCDHTDADPEISAQPDFTATFPPHCMRGTPGQALIEATRPLHPLSFDAMPCSREAVARRLREHTGEILIKKCALDPFSNPAVAIVLDLLAPEAVIVYGVAADFCVHEAVIGLATRTPRVCVVKDAIKEITREGRQRCEHEWARRGVALVTTADVVAERIVRLAP